MVEEATIILAVMMVAEILFFTYIGYLIAKRTAPEAIKGYVKQGIETFDAGKAVSDSVERIITDLDSNPEKAEKFLAFMQIIGVAVGDAALNKIMEITKKLPIGPGGIDPGQAQMAIPFLPKKYQGIAQLLMPMLGGGGNAQQGQTQQRRGNIGYG